MIKAGDVVQVICGGPTMTVERLSNHLEESGRALVVWFDGNQTLHRDAIAVDALKVCEPANFK